MCLREPPAKLSRLTKPEKPEKDKIILYEAMKSICGRYSKEASFDTFPVYTGSIRCSEDNLLYNDYDKVKSFLKVAIRDIPQYGDLVKEFKDMFSHADRHVNEITFIWCEDSSCFRELRSINLKTFFLKKVE